MYAMLRARLAALARKWGFRRPTGRGPIGKVFRSASRKSKLCIDSVRRESGFRIIAGWDWGDEFSLSVNNDSGTILRHIRPDVNRILSLPPDTVSGFVVYVRCEQNTPLRLIDRTTSRVIEIPLESETLGASSSVQAASESPASSAKAEEGFPSQVVENLLGRDRTMETIMHRLRNGGLDALEEANRQWKASFNDEEHAVRRFGTLPPNPLLTIVIPLYGTLSFLELQIARFEKDTWLKQHAEVIFVVDDPRLAFEAEKAAHRLHTLFAFPFVVVWGIHNRGFSGANNLGVRLARADHLFFLNSDAFPTQPGWAPYLLETYEADPTLGILGCRLLDLNGNIQHDGMAFTWNEALQLHLNTHPGAGLPPVPSVGVREVSATTGAAFLIKAELFRRVGGFDEGYIIGDFEDSDLCLTVRKAGYRIAVYQTAIFTHLERQSMAAVAQPDVRQAIVLANALRHERRWSSELAQRGSS